MNRRSIALLLAGLVIYRGALGATPSDHAAVRGRVAYPGGRPGVGALVTARRIDGNIAVTRSTGSDGSFALAGLAPGRYRLEVRGAGVIVRDSVDLGTVVLEHDVLLLPATAERDEPASSTWLALLPAGEAKRRFILDCTGCHVFDARIARPDGVARTRAQWRTAIDRMIAMAGAASGFPVMSAHRDTAATAEWLVQSLEHREPMPPTSTARRGSAEITEFDLPEPGDLPHDLALDRDGSVVVTGMFTSRMYVLDPASGAVRLDSIPVVKANPRAVEIDERGNWWVGLGGPKRIARREAVTGAWESWPVGVYAHSLGIARDGAVWANGHFTRDPELLVRLDPATGDTTARAVPPHPALARVPGGPVPYELRVGADGRVWLSELQGNRMIAFDPRTGRSVAHTLPIPWSGPRRFDVDARGTIWIPAYAANALVRLDPRTGRFRSFALPTPDAAPYVVRVDRRRGTVWIGTAASDEILAFDPVSRRFTAYPLPTRGALIRHLAVDAARNEVWAAYGASPGEVPARVARLRPDAPAGRTGKSSRSRPASPVR